MTVREKAPSILTEVGARRLTARIRDALVIADDLLVQAWTGRAWEALGYESWAAYTEAELPSLRLIKALPVEERAEKWAEQVRAGLSMGAVADGAGVGKATVSRALSGKELPETATGLDGKVRSTRQATVPSRNTSTPPPVPPTHVLAAQVIAQCGLEGGTTREIMRRLRWDQGPASVALSKAAKKKLVVPTGERRHATTNSIGFTVYRSA